MRVEPLPKKHRAISLTPLVDVIFLLLLFFMLSSTFTQFGQVEIGAPAAAGGSKALLKAILTVEPDRLRLNGTVVAQDDLAAKVSALTESGNDNLLVYIQGSSSTQRLVTVMSDLKSVSGLNVTVTGPK
ncbi:biopolymer transporter ExbD [Labrenzia sp. R4_2]|uniref:ExbD/TolR family protein n=1 Tax=Labrenzia sp. R4_2 TaxID=2821107 RepID=UPI001ADB60B6|nr:biopolymer transporter ExbD [Labrenzia sp. R4_2]MBO9420911.1 biopolymer transporter ExbD [Labrenzia sp. R4_2]